MKLSPIQDVNLWYTVNILKLSVYATQMCIQVKEKKHPLLHPLYIKSQKNPEMPVPQEKIKFWFWHQNDLNYTLHLTTISL